MKYWKQPILYTYHAINTKWTIIQYFACKKSFNSNKKTQPIDKRELSFNEEYTIEALFHESVHSKIKKQPENILQLAVLET